MIDIKDCEIYIDEFNINDSYIKYTKDNIVHIIEHAEYDFFSDDSWYFTIEYKRYKRCYFLASKYYWSNDHDLSWHKIPKLRKRIAEEMKELYENTILLINKLGE